MKSLKTKIYESELNEGFYKNAGGMVRPTTKEELINEIKIRVNKDQYNQYPSALNYSLILILHYRIPACSYQVLT